MMTIQYVCRQYTSDYLPGVVPQKLYDKRKLEPLTTKKMAITFAQTMLYISNYVMYTYVYHITRLALVSNTSHTGSPTHPLGKCFVSVYASISVK